MQWTPLPQARPSEIHLPAPEQVVMVGTELVCMQSGNWDRICVIKDLDERNKRVVLQTDVLVSDDFKWQQPRQIDMARNTARKRGQEVRRHTATGIPLEEAQKLVEAGIFAEKKENKKLQTYLAGLGARYCLCGRAIYRDTKKCWKCTKETCACGRPKAKDSQSCRYCYETKDKNLGYFKCGHPYTEENMYHYNFTNRCKTCRLIQARSRRLTQRQQLEEVRDGTG